MGETTDAVATMINSERLLLRDWRPAEAERMFDMYSRDDVVRFLGSEPRPMLSLDQAEAAIARAAARNADSSLQRWWAVEVRETGLVAGTAGLAALTDAGDLEVFWHLHPDSQGHGYATEAAAAALGYAHGHGVAEVLALVDPANAASLAVARRLGLEHRGLSSEYFGKQLEVFASRSAG